MTPFYRPVWHGWIMHDALVGAEPIKGMHGLYCHIAPSGCADIIGEDGSVIRLAAIRAGTGSAPP